MCSSAAPQARRNASGAWRLVRHRHHGDPARHGIRLDVIVTAGSAEKCAACVKLGAVRAINYREEDFVAGEGATEGKGANVILDMIGGDYVARNYDAAPWKGASSRSTQGGAAAAPISPG
jgi:hypothetical protein